MMENKRSPCSVDHTSFTSLASKRQKSDLSIPTKDKKDKVGERIVTLQQLVSPYGKIQLLFSWKQWNTYGFFTNKLRSVFLVRFT
ncbi:transcription factor bHLH153-like isoform X2 [Hibiscus syriacus]|uniref:transcription factor bHLH153-like isoform X2 n=1 Tax=Hibiscus syriacus TaxID=106335 RepID=UPI0019222877|nr:transcription factor bHLH153-like isoform X2 [Hibiscus syriacus]